MIGRRRFGFAILCGVFLLFGAGRWLGAQDMAPHDFGTAETNYYYVSAEEFQARTQTIQWEDAGAGGAWFVNGTSTGSVCANVRLPSGALITGMAIVYEDSDADDGLEVALYRQWWGSGFYDSEMISPFWVSSGAPGIERTIVDINPDHTVEYGASPFSFQAYRLVAWLDASYDVKLRGVVIYWNRQISPAPASATFGDVGTGHWAFRFVEALAASGITAGCGGGNFCPDDSITRAEMAVFLSAALGLHWAP